MAHLSYIHILLFLLSFCGTCLARTCNPALHDGFYKIYERKDAGPLGSLKPQNEVDPKIIVGLDFGWHTITSVISHANGTIVYGPQIDTPVDFRKLMRNAIPLMNQFMRYPEAWNASLFPMEECPEAPEPWYDPAMCLPADHIADGEEDSIIESLREPMIRLKSLIEQGLQGDRIDSVIYAHPNAWWSFLLWVSMAEMLIGVFGHIADTREVNRAEALTYAYGLRIGGESKEYSCVASGLLIGSSTKADLDLCRDDTMRRWLLYVWYGVSGLEVGLMEPQKRLDRDRNLRVLYTNVSGEKLGMTCGVGITPLVEVFLRTAVISKIQQFMEFCRDDETALGAEKRAVISFVVQGDLEQANEDWLGMERNGGTGMVQQIWGADKWESRMERMIDARYRTAWGAAVAFWSDGDRWETEWEYSEEECDPENRFLSDSRLRDLSPGERKWCDEEREYIAKHGRRSNVYDF